MRNFLEVPVPNAETFKILILLNNDRLALEVLTKLQESFRKMPVQVFKYESVEQAIDGFERHRHNLTIVTDVIPGSETEPFLSELENISGDFNTIHLQNRSDFTLPDSIQISLPLTNWPVFLGAIRSLFPDEVKAQYGWKEEDSELQKTLTNYGQKYQITPSDEVQKVPLLIPLSFYGENREPSKVDSKNIETHTGLTSQTADLLETYTQTSIPTEIIWIETGLIVTLLLLSTLAYWHHVSRQGPLWLPISLITLSAISLFGYFIGRGANSGKRDRPG